jgi:hypothetical protein
MILTVVPTITTSTQVTVGARAAGARAAAHERGLQVREHDARRAILTAT